MKKKRKARAAAPEPVSVRGPLAEPMPAPRPSRQVLMVSHTLQLGRLTFPGWPRSAVALSAICAAVLLDGLTHDRGSIEEGGEFLLASSMGVLLTLLVIYVLNIRWNRSGRTSIYKDRIEQTLNGKLVRSLHWRDVLRQDTAGADVRLITGNGDVGSASIALDVAAGNARSTVRLSTTLHPVRGQLRPYENQGALRRAFLLSLLRARPDLRIDVEVYALCEVHPATLAHDRRRKWFSRIGLGLALAVALAASGLWIWFLAERQSGVLLMMLGCVAPILIMTAGLVLAGDVTGRIFPDSEDPGVRKQRLAVLARRP